MAREWILDSGAFSTIQRFGGYPKPVTDYAYKIKRWKAVGNLLAAVSQDYMCEPQMLMKTGLTVADHQRLTIERYDALQRCETDCYIMPVLQGYRPEEYATHLLSYGQRLALGQWVGVGSICKRNGKPDQIAAVLGGIKRMRPDLRLHGFGLKLTSLRDERVRELLFSADSMAWSFRARVEGRDANNWNEARRFVQQIEPWEREGKGMSEATEIVHWPGKDVPACEKHAQQLKRVGEVMGFTVSSTPWPAGGVCTNCENEAKKLATRAD